MAGSTRSVSCGTCPGHAENRCGECVLTVLSTKPMLARDDPAESGGFDGVGGLGGHVGQRNHPGAAGTGLRQAGWEGRHALNGQEVGLALDHAELAAVGVFLTAGLISPRTAVGLRAVPTRWRGQRAVS